MGTNFLEGNRKVIILIAGLVVLVIAACFKVLDGEQLVSGVKWILGMFFAANVGEHASSAVSDIVIAKAQNDKPQESNVEFKEIVSNPGVLVVDNKKS